MHFTNKLKILSTELNLTSKNELYTMIQDALSRKNNKNIIACDFRQLLYFYEKSNTKPINCLCYPDSSGIFLNLKLLFYQNVKKFERIVSTHFHYNILKLGNGKEVKILLF